MMRRFTSSPNPSARVLDLISMRPVAPPPPPPCPSPPRRSTSPRPPPPPFRRRSRPVCAKGPRGCAWDRSGTSPSTSPSRTRPCCACPAGPRPRRGPSRSRRRRHAGFREDGDVRVDLRIERFDPRKERTRQLPGGDLLFPNLPRGFEEGPLVDGNVRHDARTASLVYRLANSLKHRERRCAASGKAHDRGVLESTARECNEAGADAAAGECRDICEPRT